MIDIQVTPEEIDACCEKIIAAEGIFHVEGRYYADAENADFWRKLLALRTLRQYKIDEYYEMVCAWCDQPILPTEQRVAAARRHIHLQSESGRQCSLEFAEFIGDAVVVKMERVA